MALIWSGASLAGLPPFLPRALAAVRPAWVRSRIRSRSNCAMAAKTVKIRIPPGVEVSIFSVSDTNSTPLSLKWLIKETRCWVERPSLSSFHTTTVSPARRRSSMRSSSGLLVFAPDAWSIKIFSHPVAWSATV